MSVRKRYKLPWRTIWQEFNRWYNVGQYNSWQQQKRALQCIVEAHLKSFPGRFGGAKRAD